MNNKGFDYEEFMIGEIITLVDDENVELNVEILEVLDINDKEYLCVTEDYLADDEEEIDVFFIRIESDEPVPVEDDEEFEMVSKEFNRIVMKYSDEY